MKLDYWLFGTIVLVQGKATSQLLLVLVMAMAMHSPLLLLPELSLMNTGNDSSTLHNITLQKNINYITGTGNEGSILILHIISMCFSHGTSQFPTRGGSLWNTHPSPLLPLLPPPPPPNGTEISPYSCARRGRALGLKSGLGFKLGLTLGFTLGFKLGIELKVRVRVNVRVQVRVGVRVNVRVQVRVQVRDWVKS